MKKMDSESRPIKWIVLGVVLVAVIAILGGQMFSISKKTKAAEKKVETLNESVTDTMTEIAKAEKEKANAPTATKAPEPSPEPTQTPEETESPEPSPDVTKPIATASLDGLPDQLAASIGEYESTGATWSYYAEDLSTGASTEYMSGQMQAASLIKLYIMGAIYEHYDALGGSALDANLYSMITVSDNDAANALVRNLGGGDDAAGRSVVNEFCQSNGYTSTSMGRMLLADKSTGDNYTSVTDCGKFLESVYNGNFTHSEDMLNLLKNQQRRNKIPSGISDGSVVANKTGELDDVENDVAIVYGPQKTYILCVMTENVSDTGATQNRIAQLASQVHAYFNS